MDNNQYMGIFGPQPLEDDYLLTSFLVPGQQDVNSKESSPSYCSSDSANGSIQSSGGSPYDYHSPTEAAAHHGKQSSISPKSTVFGNGHQRHNPSLGISHPGADSAQTRAVQHIQYGWKDSQHSQYPQTMLSGPSHGPHDPYPHPDPHGISDTHAFTSMDHQDLQNFKFQQYPIHQPIPASQYYAHPHIVNPQSLLSQQQQHQELLLQHPQQSQPWLVAPGSYSTVPQPAGPHAQPLSLPLPSEQQHLNRRRTAPTMTQQQPAATTAAPQTSTTASLPGPGPALQKPTPTPSSSSSGSLPDPSALQVPQASALPGTISPSANPDREQPAPDAPAVNEKLKSVAAPGNKRRRSDDQDADDQNEEDGPTGHNAVEKRYRTKINSSLTTLQNLIPALAHLKETEGAPSTARRSSAFILSAPQVSAFPAGTKIDGVEAPTKLSKGIIIDKGIEYISVLKDERKRLQQQLAIAEQLIDEIPNARPIYDSRLAQSDSQSPSAARQHRGRRTAVMAAFGGVGLFSAGSALTSSSWADDAASSTTATSAWSGASHLAKRATAISPTEQPILLTVGHIALLAWGLVLVYAAVSVFAAWWAPKHAFAPPSAREEALHTLNGIDSRGAPRDWSHQSTIARAHRLRSALLVISNATGYGSRICGLCGLIWQGARSYLQGRLEPKPLDVTDPDTAEQLAALVRLVELESAMGGRLCSRISRLHSFLRLHNASRRMTRPKKNDVVLSELAQARIEATLALSLVSIFSVHASPYSRRRRFWKQATTLPDGPEASTLEPWVEVALGADYEEACSAAYQTKRIQAAPSPSDFNPLLRIAEHRCIEALGSIWSQLFITLINHDASSQVRSKARSPSLRSVIIEDNIFSKADRVINATIPGSPVRPLAFLTKGFLFMVMGDVMPAREQAALLLADLREGGVSTYYASVPFFVTSVLPYSSELSFRAMSKPTSNVDLVALASLQWMSMRQRFSKLPSNSVDAKFYDATLSYRTIFSNPAWSAPELNQEPLKADFVAAQTTCIQLSELMGRQAAGMATQKSSTHRHEHDSGYEEEEDDD